MQTSTDISYLMDCLDSIIPMFSRGVKLSGREVTKVAVRNGMNGEFTGVNCEKLRREFTKKRNAKVPVACVNSLRHWPVYGTYILFKSVTLNRH